METIIILIVVAFLLGFALGRLTAGRQNITVKITDTSQRESEGIDRYIKTGVQVSGDAGMRGAFTFPNQEDDQDTNSHA